MKLPNQDRSWDRQPLGDGEDNRPLLVTDQRKIAGVLAVIEAGIPGRIAIVILLGATFLVPGYVPGPTIPYLMSAARMLIAPDCYFFYRRRNS